MAQVVIVDTGVFLNILNVPAFNQHRKEVIARLAVLVEDAAVTLLLPVATILETGNHIARLSDGGDRRRFGGIFADQVCAALSGNAPWQPIPLPLPADMVAWVEEFPEHAMQGRGFGDLSIVKAWEAACVRHPYIRVWIWTHDGALIYDREPDPF